MLFWNVVSSLGAFISFFARVFIIYIIWEGLVRKRILIITIVGYWDVEWSYDYPLAFHASNEVAKVYI
jgi:hypothetical protein